MKKILIIAIQILVSAPLIYYIRETFGIYSFVNWLLFLLIYLVNLIIYKKMCQKLTPK